MTASSGWDQMLDDDRGVAAAELAIGLLIGLMAFMTLLNGAFVVYGKGVVRGALHEGVRAGSTADADGGECQARIADALDQMLSAHYRSGVTFACATVGDHVVATADAHLAAIVPGMPDVDLHLEATALKERDPAEDDGQVDT